MDILGRIASRTPHHDPFAVFVPLQNGARSNTEPPPNFSGDGNLPLCGELRMSNSHPRNITTVMCRAPAPSRGGPAVAIRTPIALLTAVSGEDPESRGDSRSRVNASEASVWPRGHGSLRSRFELEPLDPGKALEASPLGPLADAALDGRDELTRTLVLELALVWAEFERMLRATPVIQRLENGTITVQDYKRLLVNLRQQVIDPKLIRQILDHLEPKARPRAPPRATAP